jgi:hypothetical protein
MNFSPEEEREMELILERQSKRARGECLSGDKENKTPPHPRAVRRPRQVTLPDEDEDEEPLSAPTMPPCEEIISRSSHHLPNPSPPHALIPLQHHIAGYNINNALPSSFPPMSINPFNLNLGNRVPHPFPSLPFQVPSWGGVLPGSGQ